MGCIGGMKGKENHMHNEGHYGREGQKEGKHGAASYHVSPAGGTHVANNHSGHNDHKKVAGFTKAHTGSESKAHSIESMHSGKMPNNK